MTQDATINARLPEALKRGGSRVLEENGMSPTQLIRRLYSYMEQEGRIPGCLTNSDQDAHDEIAYRRTLARSVAGSIHLPADFDAKAERAQRRAL